METTKICTKCNCDKELSEFGKNKSNKDGIQHYCKQCRNLIEKIKRKSLDSNHKEIQRKSYAKLKEKRLKEKAEYRKLNSKILAEKQAIYYKENKQSSIEYQKKYRIENKDIIKAKHKEYMKKDFAKLSKRNSSQKRRALIKDGDVTTIQLKELVDRSKKCYWCEKKIGKVYHIDHITPLCKGGLHTLSNLVISCGKCNQTKSAKDPLEFANSIGKLL